MLFLPIRWLGGLQEILPHWRRLITPALALLLAPATLLSQFPEPRFEHILRAPGLPNGLVYSMLMDRQGFLWFGYAGVLVRYDGIQFAPFYPTPDHSVVLLTHQQVPYDVY